MLVGFCVEGFAERDGVRVVVGGNRKGFAVFGESEMNLIKEVKARPVNHWAAPRLVIGPEKDGGRKDALEALHHAPVIPAILGEAEEREHLGSALGMDGAVFCRRASVAAQIGIRRS